MVVRQALRGGTPRSVRSCSRTWPISWPVWRTGTSSGTPIPIRTSGSGSRASRTRCGRRCCRACARGRPGCVRTGWLPGWCWTATTPRSSGTAARTRSPRAERVFHADSLVALGMLEREPDDLAVALSVLDLVRHFGQPPEILDWLAATVPLDLRRSVPRDRRESLAAAIDATGRPSLDTARPGGAEPGAHALQSRVRDRPGAGAGGVRAGARGVDAADGPREARPMSTATRGRPSEEDR